MKLAVIGDVHWSTYSSIWRQRGDKYSSRLENLITTLNWAERIADEKKTDAMIYVGDFFDKAELTAEELTALHEIAFNYQHHIFLVGNHEIGRASNEFSTAHLFNLMVDAEVISEPKVYQLDGKTVGFIPYVLESNRKSLIDTVPPCDIVFSHNDLKIQYGMFNSEVGYDPEEIKNHCRYFVNGHIHNFHVQDNIINIGNITGQNFSEDATKYPHRMMIIDTDTMQVEYIDNPYAVGFYKVDYSADSVLMLPELSVASVKCPMSKIDNCKEYVSHCIASKIILDRSADASEEFNGGVEFEAVDHLVQFKNYVMENIGRDDLTMSELNEVLK